MSKKVGIMIIAIIICVVLIGIIVAGFVVYSTSKVEHPIATIKIEGYDEPIIAELYPEYALNTVKNFIALANGEFYDGLKIHRVEKGFVLQGGDPNGDGSGGPTMSAIDSSIQKGATEDKKYSIVGEFVKNGYKNPLSHEKGVLSMARSSYSAELLEEGYNSAGSQFFIMLGNSTNLDGLYAGFGKVTSGMEETVDKIAEVELAVEKNEQTGEESSTTKPANDIIISSIRVDTKGVDYGMPKIKEAFDYSSWYLKQYYGQ